MNFLSSLHNKDLALLLIRVGLASVFIYHGFGKVMDMPGTVAFFASIGLGSFWAYVAAWVEFLGGILMLVGVRVREVGVLFAIIMLVAIYAVHFKNGFNSMSGGYEFQFTLLLSSLAMVFAGAGKYALLKSKECMNCVDGKCQCK